MPTRPPSLPSLPLFAVLILGFLAGCTQSRSNPAHLSTQSSSPPHIIALIAGQPVTRSQIEDDLSERAGRQALTDLILDRQLHAEMNRQGFELTSDDLAYEESLFVRTLVATDPKVPASELLNRLCASKGLGPNRYPRFLRRNAMLRKLVADRSSPSQAEYTLSERIAFGPTYRVRLFVNTDRHQAIALRKRVLSEPPNAQQWVFADACSTDSIHPSAPRGGFIPDLSTSDPNYPSILTNAIENTQPGELSSVLSTDAGYALVFVESKVPAIVPTPDQIHSVRSQLVLRKQRLEMERLADELLDAAEVIVTDPSLNWTWTNAK